MSTRLYVGNLPYSTTEDLLRDKFGASGTVTSVNIVMDAYTGRSKGFGFVEMDTEPEADAAISALNGSDMDGRSLRVDRARPREPRRAGGAERTG